MHYCEGLTFDILKLQSASDVSTQFISISTIMKLKISFFQILSEGYKTHFQLENNTSDIRELYTKLYKSLAL